MSEDTPRDQYEIGYGKPPKHTRFAPKTSGNPKGRPRGARGLATELRAELSEMVSVTIDGKTKRISKKRLIIKALVSKAAKGNVAAADKLMSLVIQAFGFEDERELKQHLSDVDQQILDQFLGGSSDEPGTDEDAKDGDGEVMSDGHGENPEQPS